MEEKFEENLMCGMCKYFRKDCKRVDGKIIKFYHPYFTNNTMSHAICRDYAPADYCVYVKAHYPGYDEYIKDPDVQKHRYFSFFIKGDDDTMYNVTADDFVNGTMWDGDTFKAFEKQYYVRTRSGFGYNLVTEPLPNGVKVDR